MSRADNGLDKGVWRISRRTYSHASQPSVPGSSQPSVPNPNPNPNPNPHPNPLILRGGEIFIFLPIRSDQAITLMSALLKPVYRG